VHFVESEDLSQQEQVGDSSWPAIRPKTLRDYMLSFNAKKFQ